MNITKWVILGGGLILLGLFAKEATTRGLTSTLHRSGLAGQAIGTGLSGIGSGIGDTFRGLLSPLWEIGNFARSFGFGSPNISGQGYSTPDPQASTERIMLTGQGGGFDDAEQQGGGSTGVNTDPIANTPNWFNFDVLPNASGIFDVGGSDIRTTAISWGNGTITKSLPLSQEARDWYKKTGVETETNTGGGSNNTTGGGGGAGSSVSFSSSGHSGYASGGGFRAAN